MEVPQQCGFFTLSLGEQVAPPFLQPSSLTHRDDILEHVHLDVLKLRDLFPLSLGIHLVGW